ncbi:MAG: urease accessory protein UreD [Pseudomonadota bacterium]
MQRQDKHSGSGEAMQRAQGRARVSWHGPSRLKDLHQSGCAKILLPQTYGAPPEAVIINTSGGITGGDRLTYAAEAGPGTQATVTTQAAERIYRASTGEAQVTTRLTIGEEAKLHWLPQETILFEGAALNRSLTVEMAPTATALIAETIILGREAMGETLTTATLKDTWRIHRAGHLIHAEALRIDAPESLQTIATLNDHRALATLAYIAPDAEDRLKEARTLGAQASAWNGKLLARWLGPPREIKAHLTRFLTHFRPHPLPRVWHL